MASRFPSLLIQPDRLDAVGAFAETQAEFLKPDRQAVSALNALLEEHRIGVVAHFYMDPELQGVLSACDWPHVHVSDSLLMADAAVEMAKGGVRAIVVLGVDFMTENVRAVLDASSLAAVPVYRVTAKPIGCSLAEAAEAADYDAWLQEAARVPRSLHIVYINTSLRSKANAHRVVPTITCTSSNVLKTTLQAADQIDEGHFWFGPDTYMGQNLRSLLGSLSEMSDDAIRSVHPAHTQASVKSLLTRFDYFRQGVCVVHHMFGEDVAEAVKHDHADALITAHLEVPGPMFRLALEAQQNGRGVVGSTSNILSFIDLAVREGTPTSPGNRLSFVLGTEAGMITSIVRKVQATLRSMNSPPEIEIIFPVARDAVTTTDDPDLALVPGVAGGEGCSVEGGCATCPYMKMNTLDALLRTATRIGTETAGALTPLEPKKYLERVDGRTTAELGTIPITHMRHFQKTGRLSDALVADVCDRAPGARAASA